METTTIYSLLNETGNVNNSLYPSWQTTSIWTNDSVPYNTTTADVTVEVGTKSLMIEILRRIHLIAPPAISIIGTICNLLAFFTFVSKPLRRTSCSLYLAARSCSDSGFLLSLFFTWIGDATSFRLYHRDGICQVVLFMTYFCGFLSVWLVVFTTIENYIRICQPFTVSRFCTVQKAAVVIIGLCVLDVLMYHFPLWIAAVTVYPDGRRFCNYLEKFRAVIRMFTYGDMALTLVLPSIIIIMLMVGITYSLITSLKRQKRLKQNSDRATKGQRQSSKKGGSKSSPQAKVTKMLFAVSFIFLVLNLPSHAVRLRLVIMTYSGVEPSKPTLDQMLQVVFQVLYYLSFAVNLGVYLVCGDNFRKVFVDRYISCFLKSKHMKKKPEMSHTSFTTIRTDICEPGKDEETSLIT